MNQKKAIRAISNLHYNDHTTIHSKKSKNSEVARRIQRKYYRVFFLQYSEEKYEFECCISPNYDARNRSKLNVCLLNRPQTQSAFQYKVSGNGTIYQLTFNN